MNSTPGITVVTPVWNGLPYIKECVESVLAQDFQNWEMVIGDNGSDDGTRDYLDSLGDPRIRVFKHGKNLQIYGNLNFLLREVRTPLVQMLCADDYFLPGGLGNAVHEWREVGDEVGLIRFNWIRTRGIARSNALCFEVVPRVVTPDVADFYYFLFGNLPGNLSNISFRLAKVREAGGFREDLPYTGDFEMWARLACRASQILSDSEVSYVRRHAGVASDYLNRKGELVGQTYVVLQTLYERLRGGFPAWLLRLHATITFDGFHRNAGVKLLLKKRSGVYLQEVVQRAKEYPVILPGFVGWVVFLVTLGGRAGRIAIPKMLIARMKTNAKNAR